MSLDTFTWKEKDILTKEWETRTVPTNGVVWGEVVRDGRGWSTRILQGHRHRIGQVVTGRTKSGAVLAAIHYGQLPVPWKR